MKSLLLAPSFARLLALALGTTVLPGAAWAQSAADGKALYQKTFVAGARTCLSCHLAPRDDAVMLRGANANAIKAATQAVPQMARLHGAITDTEFNHLARYIADEYQTAPTFIAVTATPTATVSATALTFAGQNIGTTSAAQTLTLGNAAGATGALAVSSISVTPGSDFAVTGGSCAAGSNLAAGAGCTVNVVFKPVAEGARSSTLTIAHNGTGGQSTVALGGSAVNTSPAIVVSPTALTFSSALAIDSPARRLTVSNTGTGPLVVSALTLAGSQAGDYRLAGSSTCRSGGTVAGGSSCVADVVFTPGALGPRAGTLTIAHNAAASPVTVTFSGTGTAAPEPAIALDTTTIDLGAQVVGLASMPKSLTVTNSGGSALVLGSITANGTDGGSFELGGTCTNGLSVPVRGTCTVHVAIRPVTLGVKTATLVIPSNANGGTAAVPLRAISVATPAPEVTLSQAAVGFGSVTLHTTSLGRTVRLTNTGTASMAISGIASSSAEYVAGHDCPPSLAVSAFCTITIVYKPTTANSAESIALATNATSSPNSIVVTGQGTVASLPVLTWQPAVTSLTFASTLVGVSSASQAVTLVNKGPGAVTLTSLGTAGAAASSFAIAAGSTCRLGLSLAVDASCSVSINFVPGSSGSKLANLQVGSTGTPPGDVVLSGTGASPGSGNGTVSLSTNLLDFSAFGTAIGGTSAPLSVVVSHGSGAAAAISSIRLTGPFALQSGAAGACPGGASALPVGASCTLSVVYKPTAASAATGTLTIAAGTQSVDVTLKGHMAGQLAADKSQLDFSGTAIVPGQSSAPLQVTLGNGNVAAVTLSDTRVSGPFKVTANTCPTPIPVNTSCAVSVTHVPTAGGASSGTLTLTTASGQALAIGLTGLAVANGPVLAWPAGTGPDLPFDNTTVGRRSASKTVVLTNQGPGTATLGGIAIDGPGKLSFAVTAETNCRASATLAPGGSCVVGIAFAPASVGPHTATLVVSSDASAPAPLTVSGTANAGDPPVGGSGLSSDTASLVFTGAMGHASPPATVMFTNTGTSAMTLTDLQTTGPFQVINGAAGDCTIPQTLAPAAACGVSVAFVAPAPTGDSTGELTVTGAAGETSRIPLSGRAQVPNLGNDNGGGASDLTALAGLALLGLASRRARRTTVSTSSR